MTNEIKTTGTTFDVDDAIAELAISTLAVFGRLDNLYSSVHPAIVWNETDAVREARRISSEVEYIKNKLIEIKALGHKIDVYYAEAEPGSEV